MSLNSLVSITRDSPAYYSWMWVESSRQFETPHIQEARGETVKVSNPRGHSTRTLHQKDSVCHVLWTTDLWLFNLGRPRQFGTPHIQEARGETVRVSNPRETVYVISYGPQIYDSSTWDAPELRTTNRETIYVISYDPQLYVSSTWDTPDLRILLINVGWEFEAIWKSTHPGNTRGNSKSFEP